LRSPGSPARLTSTKPKRTGASGKPRRSSRSGAETDRVYLDTPPRCIIEDRGWCRRIVIEKNGVASDPGK
jgi:D-hexose-6-phosphate mutarotase